MRRAHVIALAACAFLFAAFFAVPARAALLITIDKTSQRMIVALNDLPVYDWPVSTGQRGYDTPLGEFKPFRMEKDHFSREWDDAPMPHAIFFTQIGHAIHGSFEVKRLGAPASHGCVRLEPKNAAALFALVKQEGMANTRVILTGKIPAKAGVPVARARGVDPYGDDGEAGGFTGALSSTPAKRSAKRPREERRDSRAQAAFYDGRYYYDRHGRRIDGPSPATPRYTLRGFFDRQPR